jgi:prevent-host-death family protein
MSDTTLPVRTLRNDVSAVLRRVEAGERFVVTVDRRPVARLEPLERRRPFVPWPEIVQGLAARAADPGLRADLRRLLPDTVADL